MKWTQKFFKEVPLNEFYCVSRDDNPIRLKLEIVSGDGGYNLYINDCYVEHSHNSTVEVAQSKVESIANKKVQEFLKEILLLNIEDDYLNQSDSPKTTPKKASREVCREGTCSTCGSTADDFSTFFSPCYSLYCVFIWCLFPAYLGISDILGMAIKNKASE